MAFTACVLSLLLHLQRKYLGYFCRGDVTVWLHEHLHGFGEVRAARPSLSGGAKGATVPGVQPGWLIGRGAGPGIHEDREDEVDVLLCWATGTGRNSGGRRGGEFRG